ncbi:2-succinyl-5-enolpyruvyl-6-hydroxy-3-cyclohexene-1-carboxylate synthase [Sulfurimonas sp. CVO]|uniref:thiamine pyrophosphate-binding protein n=1 Tax=Sulfurimonas sp. CVO TaxID=2283483 RepID=UPI00132F0927|nr:thiamine pyrophosphate-binding protein [Sulfurimonas sp. CVO]QHG91864.1 2-succinyl-5-enolpyruvyl-6-hydroxy-3-cyclohexene-1-carboxylate synthase [Sulfurimonas sp. CVO]
MKTYYSDEKNVQILISVLKVNKIKKIIASPGATNVTFVRSLQNDPFFELYSAVDERSAAYMACGLAAESGEPVVLSCTGATASRNYLPALTEAYYRKLPVLAVTSSQDIAKIGHMSPQLIDRTVMPKDTVKLSVHLPIVKDDDDFWSCEVKVNSAILELFRNGGGPVHINLTTKYSKNFDVEKLPDVRAIKRITLSNDFPSIENKKIAIFVGSHQNMCKELTQVIDDFCASNDAVVFCDHTSGYYGNYKVLHSISSSQTLAMFREIKPDLTIHIGEITGDYSCGKIIGKSIWRVSEDGEIRDTFRKLKYVFEMPEIAFFKNYTKETRQSDSYLKVCKYHMKEMYQAVSEVPFSNIWLAKKSHDKIPQNSVVHFGILNSLRAWNLFDLPQGVESASNVGGFGIDGCVSSLIGASLANKEKLYFSIVGDLAFFYDMNSIGNRHVGKNVRILLINNGIGTEFKNFNHPAAAFGESSDAYHAAGGHFGNKSKTLVKGYAQSLGFEYMSASSKKEYEEVYERFFTKEMSDKPMLLEVFTNDDEESDALETVTSMVSNTSGKAKNAIRGILGDKGVKAVKGFLRR